MVISLDVQLTSHLHGLKATGSSYFSGFKCTAGGQTITAQPAGIVCPAIRPIGVIYMSNLDDIHVCD